MSELLCIFMAAIVHELSVCVYLRFQQTLAFSPSPGTIVLRLKTCFKAMLRTFQMPLECIKIKIFPFELIRTSV